VLRISPGDPAPSPLLPLTQMAAESRSPSLANLEVRLLQSIQVNLCLRGERCDRSSFETPHASS
jgi:hypothetical protein